MRAIGNVLAISGDKGFFIGRPVQAYLDKKTLKLKGFLCQLFGLPARLIYCEFSSDLVNVDNSSINLSPINNPTLVDFTEVEKFVELKLMVPVRGLAMYSEDDGFLGYLEDFDIDIQSFQLNQVCVSGEKWSFKTSPYIKEIDSRSILVFKDLYHGREGMSCSFFNKEVIQVTMAN
ncbi:MAG: hypothetical protein HOE90_06485 [Bacteriovoracaceae bacterium]|jgi:hypothetical protein|nr:hypothetical protein [Bacteriovoracaceae bacterium]